jgi:hypothetical protein
MIVDEQRNPTLFRYITNRNLLWQFDLLIDAIRIGLPRQLKLNDYLVSSLNFVAVVNIAEMPGMLRNDHVHIHQSDHVPPAPTDAKEHYLNFFPHVHQHWNNWDALTLAAYTLWRLTWIHPFFEGNGRTARAATYYVLSIKMGRLLEGTDTIPAQIRRAPRPFYELLRLTDKSHEREALDLAPLSDYLGNLLERQLASK